MLLVAFAWAYVVLMVAVAEAVSSTGTVLGAAMTLIFYGLVPLSILLYLMGTGARRRARRRAEAEASDPASAVGVQRDGSGHAAGDAIAPEREEA